jgi:hypothetical protein
MVHMLAKISGIFFEADTFTVDGKKQLIDLLKDTLKIINATNMLQDKYSINFIQANIAVDGSRLLMNNNTDQKIQASNTEQDDVKQIGKLFQEQVPEQSSHDLQNNINSGEEQKDQPKRVSFRNCANTTQSNEVTRNTDRYNTRLELRLNIQGNTESNENVNTHLRNQLQTLINQLLEVDKNIQFLPWFERENNVPLEKNTIPDDQRIISRYFQRLQPTQTGYAYGEFRIQHKRKWEDIIFDITPWLSENKHGLYYQTLQCPLTTNVGWLLWSFRRIDTKRLQQELMDLYNIQVNFRYQNIAIGRGNTKNVNLVRALHVIANQKQADKISSWMQKIYSFDTSEFPLGITMRFIPHILRVKDDKQAKIIQWRNRQQTFLKAIEDPARPMNATSWEITLLDGEIAGFGTLRKNIMMINSKERINEGLFLSVDQSYFRSNEIIFTFLPRHETEARAFVANIVPYFQHKYNSSFIKDIFHQEALQRAGQSIWNADTQEIVSPADIYLEQSGDICDTFDMLEVMGIEPNNNNTTTIQATEGTEIQRVERLFVGEDSASIGTLFTNDPNQHHTQSNPSYSHNQSSQTRSVSTTITMEDVEKKLNGFSSELDEIKNMMKTIIQNTTQANNTEATLTNLQVNTNPSLMITEDENTINKRKAEEVSTSLRVSP